MARPIVLLPSVLLGPASWGPTSETLRAVGRDVTVANTGGARRPAEVRARYLSAAPERPATWVGHSNAGLYLPAILSDRQSDIGIFVDASLPESGPTCVSAEGPRLKALRKLAGRSGTVPGWIDWWSEQQLADLLPDAALRRVLREEAVPLPLTYFTSPIVVPDEWSTTAAAYLSFDGQYVHSRERMAAAGWPTAHIHGQHLHVMSSAAQVVHTVLDLERQLIGRPR